LDGGELCIAAFCAWEFLTLLGKIRAVLRAGSTRR
jgi:hypothetical protein